MKTLFDTTGADLSDCRLYRYALWRHWDWQSHGNCVMFIGLNPSTADETKNDTTISKCIGFAKRWGYGGIYMLNLYAFRTTYPAELVQADSPVGSRNDKTFSYYGSRAGKIVAAWGALEQRHRKRMRWDLRIAQVLDCLGRQVYCLGTTKDGSPRHPSRLAYSTERELFWTPGG